MDLQFGSQAHFLVDFYHLCEYLSAAAEVVAGKEGIEKKAWMEEKKDWLKDNRWPELLETLRPYVEDASVRARISWITKALWPLVCRSVPVRLRVPIAMSSRTDSKSQEPGGRWKTSARCSLCAWCERTEIGKITGAVERRLRKLTRTFNYTPRKTQSMNGGRKVVRL
jgi:hypothetical protein